MKKARKTAQVQRHCVSCGACVKTCPFQAITIFKGVIAQVDSSLCVGCGKCAKVCPANAITIHSVKEVAS